MAGLSAENPLRNAFNTGNIGQLAASLGCQDPTFDLAGFCAFVLNGFEQLGFGQRATRIREALERYLPADFEKAANLLIAALGPELPLEGVASLDGFIVMPQCMFVSSRGKNSVELSLRALYEMTKRFSAEGELRTFIELDYPTTMATLERWCRDPNPHVRRLVSEGTRPRLPLASRIKRFQKDPLPVLDLLERLKADPALYVRRSVANNLNDISKDHPDLVLQTLQRWSESKDANTQWLVRHALRSLIKQGLPGALALMGFEPPQGLTLEPGRVEGALTIGLGEAGGVVALPEASVYQVTRGSKVRFIARLSNRSTYSQNLHVDYIVHFVKAKGNTRPKVFKYSSLRLEPGSSKDLAIAHHFVDTSGRTHYPGLHRIELQINGQIFPAWQLVLTLEQQ